mmetsp:Transcript_17569/g.45820  ORF Transcript_17569/g.45820 Transcript_17569/m.45820 type:complete len:110 (+) Transcript_17569:578-907(+)
MVFLRSAISTIYEPSIKSIIMDSARSKTREKMGSFAGLQQSMKGMAQVMGSFWGSFLASYDAYHPVNWSALVAVANAAIVYHVCVVPRGRATSLDATEESNRTEPKKDR